MNISTRKANIEEIADLEGLYKNLKDLEKEKFAQACSVSWSFQAQDKKYFGNRITSPNGIVLVAERENDLVGFICGYLAEDLDIDGRRYAQVENIYVSSAVRGEGVGGVLVKAFESYAKELNAKVIKVSPIIANQSAIGFYAHEGFQQVAVVLEKEI